DTEHALRNARFLSYEAAPLVQTLVLLDQYEDAAALYHGLIPCAETAAYMLLNKQDYLRKVLIEVDQVLDKPESTASIRQGVVVEHLVGDDANGAIRIALLDRNTREMAFLILCQQWRFREAMATL